MKRRAAIVASVAFALGLLSCQLLLEGDRPKPDPDPPDAAIVDPCGHRLPPGRPEVDDDTDTANDYWLAIREMQIPVLPDAGIHPGFDLDKSCTCQKDLFDAEPPCLTPSAATTSCDFEGGVDDSVGQVAGEFSAVIGEFGAANDINDKITSGVSTLLIYISNYNGKANDTDVSISFVGAGGVRTNLGCDNAPRGPAPAGDPAIVPPLWDGCDRWSPTPGIVTGSYPDRKIIANKRGWVVNSTLVAEIDNLNFGLFSQQTSFSNGYVVLNLRKVNEGDGLAATGLLTGRVAAAEMADILGRTDVKGTPLCKTPFWAVAEDKLCSTRDTMKSPSQDHDKDGLRVCDASTLAMGFTAFPAKVADGDVTIPERVREGCDTPLQCPTPAGARK